MEVLALAGSHKKRHEARLAQAMRWRDMFKRAEQMAERYGRPMLAIEYHQLAVDWSEKVEEISASLR